MTKQPKKKQSKRQVRPVEKKTTKKKQQSFVRRVGGSVQSFLHRRPHRSFRRTRRRDYRRSLKLPGYWAFTMHVLSVIRANRKQFAIIGVIYVVTSCLLLGIGSQEAFTELRGVLSDASQQAIQGDWSEFGQASILALSTITGAASPNLTEVQQVYAVILGLLMWLVIVWFLRQRLAKGVVNVRDALYNAGSPIIPMTIIFLVLLVQLLPIALTVIAYSAAQASGLLAGGIEAMLFWLAAAGLVALSIYWLVGSALALVVVTIPGMYPWRALRLAGNMAVGRRLRILYRLAWMGLMAGIAWIAVLVPTIMIDSGIKQIWPGVEWLPTIPLVVLLLGCLSFIWMATYIYLLYRGIVDDDAKPA